MAILYKVDGPVIDHIKPKNSKMGFQLEELYAMLNCSMIEIVYLNKKEIMIIDEEGRLNNSGVNDLATNIFEMNTHIFDFIVGNALVCSKGEFK